MLSLQPSNALNFQSSPGIGSVAYHEIVAVNRSLSDRAVSYAADAFGPNHIHQAWQTFRVWLSPWVDLNAEDWPLFLQWYVYHWRPRSEAGSEEGMRTIAERFVNQPEAGLSDDERELMLAAMKKPPDFYEIFSLDVPRCYYVKSLLLGFEFSFAFEELPHNLNPGDIFFGKILHLEADRGAILGYSRPLPLSAKASIAELRIRLVNKRKAEFVTNFALFETDVFNLYHDILQS